MNAVSLCYTVIILSIIIVNWDDLKRDHKAFVKWCVEGGWAGLGIYAAICLVFMLAMMPWYWL